MAGGNYANFFWRRCGLLCADSGRQKGAGGLTETSLAKGDVLAEMDHRRNLSWYTPATASAHREQRRSAAAVDRPTDI